MCWETIALPHFEKWASPSVGILSWFVFYTLALFIGTAITYIYTHTNRVNRSRKCLRKCLGLEQKRICFHNDNDGGIHHHFQCATEVRTTTHAAHTTNEISKVGHTIFYSYFIRLASGSCVLLNTFMHAKLTVCVWLAQIHKIEQWSTFTIVVGLGAFFRLIHFLKQWTIPTAST